MAAIWGDSGGEQSLDRPEFGRPRPESPLLMTARQLVYACTEARTDDDMEYAVGEVESFIDANGDDLDSSVLIALLDLPDDELTRPALADVSARLADRTPGVVEAVLRAATSGAGPSFENAAAVLDMLPETELALGLVEVLTDNTEDELKEAAANVLVVLGKPAVSIILDALADPTAREWIVYASGCPNNATDADVMRAIASAPGSSDEPPGDPRHTGGAPQDSPGTVDDAHQEVADEAADDTPDDAADSAPDDAPVAPDDTPDDAPADEPSSDLEAELERDIAAFEEHLKEEPGAEQG